MSTFLELNAREAIYLVKTTRTILVEIIRSSGTWYHVTRWLVPHVSTQRSRPRNSMFFFSFFSAISALEDETNTLIRNVGNNYPVTRRHIPEILSYTHWKHLQTWI